MDVRISSDLLQRVMALAAADPDREVCGLLTGTATHVTGILPAANIHPEPRHRFELDPAVHFAALRAARADGPAVIGHYHSHPRGAAEPSATDAALALEPGQLWLIVGQGGARLWQVSHPGTFRAVALHRADGAGCASPPEPPKEPPSAGMATEDPG